MRKARSVAWFSTAGFHQRSKWKTWLARVRLSPVPPALMERTNRRGAWRSARWKRSTSRSRAAAGVPPWRKSTSWPNRACEVRLQQPAHLGVLGEDAGRGRPPPAPPPASPPAGSACRCGRPGRCWSCRKRAGWSQTCFSLVSAASTWPRRSMPSAASISPQRVAHDRLVERGLLAGEGAVDLHLLLLGQVLDDRPVGLQPAQDERRHQPLEALGRRRRRWRARWGWRSACGRPRPSRGSRD